MISPAICKIKQRPGTDRVWGFPVFREGKSHEISNRTSTMNAAFVLIFVLVFYFLGYRFYSRFLAEKLFELGNNKNITPAERLNDNKDYVPSRKVVLWGHHFASIAGAAHHCRPCSGCHLGLGPRPDLDCVRHSLYGGSP